MSSMIAFITLANAFKEIPDGYAKLHEHNGRGGLPIGLQQGNGPLGTQLRPNQPPIAKDAYRAPTACDSYTPSNGGATQYAFAFNARQSPSAQHIAEFTHQAGTEPGITPAVWPYANPFTAALPDQPYQPNRIPAGAAKNLYNLNNPYPFGADIQSRMIDVFA